MVETGEGSLEPGDASGEIFWMQYPDPFLKHFFESFPDLMPKPKDAVDTVGKRDDHKSTGQTVSKADDRVEGFPHLKLMAVSKASRISVLAHQRCTGTMHSKQTR
jgi:hypothetical protein